MLATNCSDKKYRPIKKPGACVFINDVAEFCGSDVMASRAAMDFVRSYELNRIALGKSNHLALHDPTHDMQYIQVSGIKSQQRYHYGSTK